MISSMSPMLSETPSPDKFKLQQNQTHMIKTVAPIKHNQTHYKYSVKMVNGIKVLPQMDHEESKRHC